MESSDALGLHFATVAQASKHLDGDQTIIGRSSPATPRGTDRICNFQVVDESNCRDKSRPMWTPLRRADSLARLCSLALTNRGFEKEQEGSTLSFALRTYRVLIASPSDSPEERQATPPRKRSMTGTPQHAVAESVVLMRLMQEADPERQAGVTPQEATLE